MLDRIGEETNVPLYIDMAKDKSNSFRIMGFGHRVYKNYDPRAKVMQEMCHAIIESDKETLETHFDDVLKRKHNLEVAMALEKVALEDKYFINRKLFPNVDFYSGIVLQ